MSRDTDIDTKERVVLQSNVQFHREGLVMPLFEEGRSPWGQRLSPSLAHFIEIRRSLSIAFPNAGLQHAAGLGTLPHVLDPTSIRLHVDAALSLAMRRMQERSVGAILRCDIGDGCDLTAWGRLLLETPLNGRDPSARGATAPAVFTLEFWEVSREAARRRALETQAALSRCAQ